MSSSTLELKQRSGWIARLTRITTSGRFIPEIDGLRFFAIMSVVLHHHHDWMLARLKIPYSVAIADPISNALTMAIKQMTIGVQLFFVISGFILALPFAEAAFDDKQRPGLGKYLLRRVTRLEPPYVLMLLYGFVFWVAASAQGLVSKPTTAGELFPHLLASLFYVHTLVFGDPSHINAVAWSLEVEVQFYLLAPLLGYVFYIRRAWIRRGIMVGACLGFGILNDLINPASMPRLHLSIVGQAQYFIAGLLFADIYLTRLRQREAHSWRWDMVGLGVAVAFWVVLLTTEKSRVSVGTLRLPLVPMTVMPFIMLLGYIAALRSVALNWLVRTPFLFLIGGMCYTIYLYHSFVGGPLPLLTRGLYNPNWPFWLNYIPQFLTNAVMMIGMCGVIYVLVERPCMDRYWPQKLWKRLFGRKAEGTLEVAS